MHILVVESPAKAKTINKYLGSDYKVLASYGHIRDLPSKDGSVLPEKDFAVIYEVDKDAAKNVKEIADAVKKADSLILATDPDREGEAISWHVVEVLKEKKALKDIPVKRVVFNEITKKAVQDAISHPRDIDMDLVNAQQARRILDYLVGFNLSPILWRKLPGSRSAGRVQSVALRLICEREDEIEKFVSQEYWDIKVDLAKSSGDSFSATLTHINGDKLDKFSLSNEPQVTRVAESLKTKSYTVKSIEKKQQRRNPYPPFTTSTLQQEASRKLGFTAKRTMQLAQKLYEGVDIGSDTAGLITYMRTDGVQVADEAISAARSVIAKKFGQNYVPGYVRKYESKLKNAQEAHEAIRPTDITRDPDSLKKYLDGDMLDLYDLIWKRMVASQMESAVLDQVIVDIKTTDDNADFRAVGSTLKFPGFYAVYRERDEDEKEDEDEDRSIPPLEEGESLKFLKVNPAQHFTEPPPRYTEASLVKKLEELGIGRPSTYASIIAVLQDREYVKLEKKRFEPEDRGRLVTAFLRSFFKKYVQYDFTAKLEDELDLVSDGKLDWKTLLRSFWQDFSDNVETAGKLDYAEVLNAIDSILGPHFFPEKPGEDARKCPSCETGRIGIRLGKFGAFIGCSNYPECSYTRALDRISVEEAEETVGEGEFETKVLGMGKDDQEITLRKGPYGFYIQVGEGDKKNKPKRVGIPKTMDYTTVDLEKALALLTLPRTVGKHPDTGKVIKAGIGRFGPYLQHDGKYKSLGKDDDVLTVGINRAVDLLAQVAEKSAKAAPIKVLGKHPDDEKEVAVYKGRYGPYVKHGKINATLPKDEAPESVTMETALLLLAKKKTKAKKKKK